MTDFPRNIEERNRLVSAYWESVRQTSWPAFQTQTDARIEKEYAVQDRLLDEYAEWLPFVPVSRCPFTGQRLEYVFDPFGLDGMWWSSDLLVECPEPQGSKNFRVLLGAVDFRGREPTEAVVHTVLPGPGVPFVVPQLLEIAGMKAVVSQIDMAHGDRAYLTAYFSEEPVHGGFLHQSWARKSYQVYDTAGEYESWSISNEKWDFDLGSWVDRGLVLWIAPGDEDLVLRKDRPCPYEGIQGAQAPQEIERGELYLLDPPGGGPADPLD